MTRSLLVWMSLIVLSVGWMWQKQKSPSEQAAVPAIEQLQFEAFDCGRRQVTVRAERGTPSTQRIGFLRTALIPTLELEQVTIERPGTAGVIETFHVPLASVNWVTKTISTPNHERIFSASSLTENVSEPELRVQPWCQG